MAEKKKRGLLFDDIVPEARRMAGSLFSLDPQENIPAAQQAIEMALGFVPGVGQAMALRDIERARRAEDPAAAALAATSFVPFGKLASVASEIPGVSRIAEFDPRFDTRVKEQGRLKELSPVIESRGTVNPPEVSLSDFEGRPFITSMSDRTAAGGLLRAINDVELARPVNLQGGQDFMFENPGMVWASGNAPTKKIMKLAKEIKNVTGEDPLYIPWRMAPTGGDFASMTGETMLNYADVALGKKTKREMNSAIKQLIPDWAGIGTEKGIAQFRSAPDKIRKKIKKNLDVNFREQGGLSIGEARLAVTDPRQYTAPESGIQNIGVIHTERPIISQSGHAAYPAGVPGEGIGRIKEDVRVFELLEDAAKARGILDPRAPSARDVRALQMKPYAGRISAEMLKRMGF